MNGLDVVYFTLSGAIIVTMAFGIAVSFFMPSLDQWSKRYFITLFSLLFLCAISCFLELIFYNDPTKATTQKVVYFFEALLLSVPIFMPTIFLLHCSREKIKSSPLFLLVMLLLVIFFALLLVAQFTKAFYYVTSDNQFFYGPFYSISLVPMILILLLNILGTIKRRKALSKKIFISISWITLSYFAGFY